MQYFQYEFYVVWSHEEDTVFSNYKLKITDGPVKELESYEVRHAVGWIIQNIDGPQDGLSVNEIHKINDLFLSGVIYYGIDEYGNSEQLIKHFIFIVSAHDPIDADANAEEFKNYWIDEYRDAFDCIVEESDEHTLLEHTDLE